MGAADGAEKYDDTINCSPFLLRREQLLLIKLWGIFLDTGPGFWFTQVLGNSEQWKMTRREDNVGFVATGSGVKQFQPCEAGSFVLEGAPHNTGENPPYGMNGGGGANIGMTRGLFATQLERADTQEAIGLNRPRLRSTRPIII